MLPVSSAFLDSLRYSRVPVTRADLYNGETLVLRNILVTEGSVTANRKDNARRQCSMTLAFDPDLPLPDIDPYKSRIQVYSGTETKPGESELVPVGRFRVQSMTRSGRQGYQISGTSMESVVIDDRFFRPRKPVVNRSTISTIQQLILESYPAATFKVSATKDKRVKMTAPWERERWEAINTLADSIVAEVYCDPTGVFVIKDKPDYTNLATAKPVWTINEGPGGVLVSLDTTETRDKVYNVVIVTQANTDENAVPMWAYVADTNPRSRTYVNGPFGRVPRFYSNPNIRRKNTCIQIAVGMLAESIAQNKSVDFTSLPNPALEPGDIVRVASLTGTFQNHVIETLQMPFGLGLWSSTTKASKADDVGDVSA